MRIFLEKMGKILRSERNDTGVRLEVQIDCEEANILQGHYDDVHLFTERVAEYKTNISSRGKNSVTKYFLIPRSLRPSLNFRCKVGCQKIETDDKIMFIYVVDKNQESRKR